MRASVPWVEDNTRSPHLLERVSTAAGCAGDVEQPVARGTFARRAERHLRGAKGEGGTR